MRKSLQLTIILLSLLFLSITWDSWSYSLRMAGLIFLVVGALIWLGFSFRASQPFHLPVAVLPLLAYFILQGIFIFIVKQPVYGIDLIIRQLVIFVFFIFCYDLLKQGWNPRIMEYAILFLILIFAFLETYFFGAWLFNWFSISGSMLVLPPIHYRSSGILLQHPNVLAGFVNLGYPLILYKILRAKNNRKFIWSIMLFFLLFTSFSSASRGGWIGLVSGIGIFTVLMLNKKKRIESLHFSLEPFIRLNHQKKIALLSSSLLTLLIIPLLINQLVLSPRHGNWQGRFDLFSHAISLFLESPLFGGGPGAYSQSYSHVQNSVPGFSTPHAHNLLLQIAAENGLFGLSLFFLSVYRVLKSHMKALHNQTNEKYWRGFVVYSSIAAAILIHQLVDYLFLVTFYSAGVAVLSAIYFAEFGQSDNLVFPRKYFHISLILIVACIYWGTSYSIKGLDSYWTGTQFTYLGNWKDAKISFCKASQQNQEFSLYAFQCGLANSFMAKKESDTVFFSDAIASLNQGLEIDSEWPVHWANLAAIEWQEGDYNKAIADMQKAVTEAPQQPLFLLNLGWMEEMVGNERVAERAYALAAFLDPQVTETFFFQKNRLRTDSIRHAKKLSNLSNLIFDAGLRQDLPSSKTPQELANIYMISAKKDVTQKKTNEAWRKVNQALFINRSNSILLEAAVIARSLGKEDAAEDFIGQIFDSITHRKFSDQYYFVYYYRNTPITDLSPFLVTVELTPALRNQLEIQILQYREEGKDEEADSIQKWITEQLEY